MIPSRNSETLILDAGFGNGAAGFAAVATDKDTITKKTIKALPGFEWVEVEAPAREKYRHPIFLKVPEPTSIRLDELDL